MNKPVINGLLNVNSKIECNNIVDYKKKFYPITTVDEITLSVVKIPYLNTLFLFILFILKINPIKLFVLNKKLKL